MSLDRSDLDKQAEDRAARDLSRDAGSETQALFLLRLQTLLDRRHGAGAKLTPDQQLLVDRAIYSTFCDCLELGLSTQARALLKEHQAG